MRRIIYVAVDYIGNMTYIDEEIDNSQLKNTEDLRVDINLKLRNFDSVDHIYNKLSWPEDNSIIKPKTPGLYKLTTQYKNVEYPDMLFGAINIIESFCFEVIKVEKCFDVEADKKVATMPRKKIFISIAKENLSPSDYAYRYTRAIEYLNKFTMGTPYDLLDPTMHIEKSKNQLTNLSKTLELMSQADWAYFACGWDRSKQCRLENQCAQEYGIQTIYEEGFNKHAPITILLPINNDDEKE